MTRETTNNTSCRVFIMAHLLYLSLYGIKSYTAQTDLIDSEKKLSRNIYGRNLYIHMYIK